MVHLYTSQYVQAGITISQCVGWAEISQPVVKHGRASQLNEGELNGDHVDGGDDNNLWWNCSLF